MQRCSVIRNWVDTESIYPITGKENAFREQMDIDPTQFVVLVFGSPRGQAGIASSARCGAAFGGPQGDYVRYSRRGSGACTTHRASCRPPERQVPAPTTCISPKRTPEHGECPCSTAGEGGGRSCASVETRGHAGKWKARYRHGRPRYGASLAACESRFGGACRIGRGMALGILRAMRDDLREQVAIGIRIAASLDAKSVLLSFEAALARD